MSIIHRATAVVLVATFVAGPATGQRLPRVPDDTAQVLGTATLAAPPRPASPAAEAWIANDLRDLQAWRIAKRDDAGLVLAKPAGRVDSKGVVPVDIRIEYREPLSIANRAVRSVSGRLEIDCEVQLVNGPVLGFAQQNLSGERLELASIKTTLSGPGRGKANVQHTRAEALKLLDAATLRGFCDEGQQHILAQYGPGWTVLLSDENGTRLASAPAPALGLDQKLALRLRVEPKISREEGRLLWRSALADVQLDCAERSFTAKTTFFAGPGLAGRPTEMLLEGRDDNGVKVRLPGQAWPDAKLVPGERPKWAGASLMAMLRDGRTILAQCDTARAKLAEALSRPGDPLRLAAETWAAKALNTKGWRMPNYLPEGVMLLSEEVASEADGGRRAVIRTEYNRPMPVQGGKTASSRITVLQMNCATRQVRGLSEMTFAANGAKDLVAQAATNQAPWSSFEEQPTLTAYFEAACQTPLSGS